jgi:hypothetical protein
MADVQGGLQSAAPRNCATQPGAAILRPWNGSPAALLGAAGCGQPRRGATCHRPGAGLCELALLKAATPALNGSAENPSPTA